MSQFFTVKRVIAFILVVTISGCVSVYSRSFTNSIPLMTAGYGSVKAIKVSPDGKNMLTLHAAVPSKTTNGYMHPPMLRVWSISDKQPIDIRSIDVTQSSVYAPEFDLDGRSFIFGDRAGLKSADLNKMLREDRNSNNSLPVTSPRMISPGGGKWVASRTQNAGGISEWVVSDTKTGKIAARLPENVTQVLAFSPSATLLATSVEGATENGRTRIAIWDFGKNSGNVPPVSKVSEFEIRHFGDPDFCRFSPGGKKIAIVIKSGTVGIWDTQTGKQFEELPSLESVNVLEFSPNPEGEYLAVGYSGTQGKIILWDIAKPKVPRKTFLDRETKSITAVSFSPDGKVIFSGDESGNIKQWVVEQ